MVAMTCLYGQDTSYITPSTPSIGTSSGETSSGTDSQTSTQRQRCSAPSIRWSMRPFKAAREIAT